MAVGLTSLAGAAKMVKITPRTRGTEMRLFTLLAIGICLVGSAALAQPKSAVRPTRS